MVAAVVNLAIEQGATYRNVVTWKTGTPPTVVNLTGYTARMQLRSSPSSTTPVLSLTSTASSAGQLILGGVAGTIEVYIKDSTTDTLSGGGVYDLEVVAPNTDVIRLMQGKYTVSPNVTKV